MCFAALEKGTVESHIIVLEPEASQSLSTDVECPSYFVYTLSSLGYVGVLSPRSGHLGVGDLFIWY